MSACPTQFSVLETSHGTDRKRSARAREVERRIINDLIPADRTALSIAASLPAIQAKITMKRLKRLSSFEDREAEVPPSGHCYRCQAHTDHARFEDMWACRDCEPALVRERITDLPRPKKLPRSRQEMLHMGTRRRSRKSEAH